jgi:hypothetical protein
VWVEINRPLTVCADDRSLTADAAKEPRWRRLRREHRDRADARRMVRWQREKTHGSGWREGNYPFGPGGKKRARTSTWEHVNFTFGSLEYNIKSRVDPTGSTTQPNLTEDDIA